MVFHDSLPELFIPVGFVGGLYDADTGLTRFGFRDYDPQIGRFTAKDPLGDTGGDHDVYDYCVDDPIGSYDDLGLSDKSIWQRIKEETIPLYALEGEEKDAFIKRTLVTMERKMYGLTSGLQGIMEMNESLPAYPFLPGPSKKDIDGRRTRHIQRGEAIKRKEEELDAIKKFRR